MIIVFVELDGEDSKRRKERFDSWREFALLVPIFCEEVREYKCKQADAKTHPWRYRA